MFRMSDKIDKWFAMVVHGEARCWQLKVSDLILKMLGILILVPCIEINLLCGCLVAHLYVHLCWIYFVDIGFCCS